VAPEILKNIPHDHRVDLWIFYDHDWTHISKEARDLRLLRVKKSRLRSLARDFMGYGDQIRPVEVATQAQAAASELSKT
jgi:hypothetical protein